MWKFIVPILVLIVLVLFFSGRTSSTLTAPKQAIEPASHEPKIIETPTITPSPVPTPKVGTQPAQTDTEKFLAHVSTSTTNTDVFAQAHNHVIARHQDGDWIVLGDILVDETQLVPDIDSHDARIARIGKVEYWPHGIVPYEVESGMDKARIQSAMTAIGQSTPVRFVEMTGESDFLSFRSSARKECLSYLGRKGGEQQVKLHSSCEVGSIMHELLHALGFVHEHSREDRDTFVEIFWDNIEPAHRNQFQKLPAPISIPVAGTFDFDSIMLYDSIAFAIEGKSSLKKKDGASFKANRKKLSTGDIAKITLLYPDLTATP